jgi:predicted TIM-barrel fold metal-dependent hydrolase
MVSSSLPASKSGLYADPRENWLSLRKEEILDPARPIVDPHHHLWDRGGQRYLIEELAADIASGHNIIATVYVEARSMYRAGGAEEMRPVGEVEFAGGAAAMSASGGYGDAAICAGIVGHANLLLGEGARAVLEAEIAAGNGRFRGIRHSSPWDANPDVAGMYALRPKGLLLDATFRKGFACLAPLNLSFDSWLFHPQIGELADLARAFPDTKIVLDHCGGPIGVGGYANRREEIFNGWKASIRDMSQRGGEARRAGDAAIGLRFSRTSAAALLGGSGRGVAPLYRDLHRGVRSRPGHVREQFSAGQGSVQLSGDLQRLQAHRRALQRGREDRVVFEDGDGFLPAQAWLMATAAKGSAQLARLPLSRHSAASKI